MFVAFIILLFYWCLFNVVNNSCVMDAQEEDHAVIEDEHNMVILAPIHTSETIFCPECNSDRLSKKQGKYGGQGALRRFILHLETHKKEDNITPFFTVSSRCRACGYLAMENSAAPWKEVGEHFKHAHRELVPVRLPTRRDSVREQLGLEPVRPQTRRNSAPAAVVRGPEEEARNRSAVVLNASVEPSFPAQTHRAAALPADITARSNEVSLVLMTPTRPMVCSQQPASTEALLPGTSPAAASSSSNNDVFWSPSGRVSVTSPVMEEQVDEVQQDDLASSLGSLRRVSPRNQANGISPAAMQQPATNDAMGPNRAQGAVGSRGLGRSTEEQRQLVAMLDAVNNNDDLEVAVRRVATFLQRLKPLPEEAPDQNNNARGQRRTPTAHRNTRTVDRVIEATRIQKQYRANRKKTVQRILNGPTSACKVSKHTVEAYFTALAAPRHGEDEWPDVFNVGAPSEESTSALLEPFTSAEVQKKLKHRANSAPGPDGLTYGDLRKADPQALVTTSLFNAVWRLQHFPDGWKDSNTTLLHKKGDKGDLSNWRPIAVGDTCPKLLAAILADRIKKWAISNKRYSPSQKGFLKFEGCYEHNFVLQEAIEDARRSKKEIVVTWIDFASAFTSVPHSSIFRALESHGLPPKVQEIIRSMYDGSRTQIRTEDGFTNPIVMEAGVKQGCPLSPDTFNLTLEVVLRMLSNTGIGYNFRNIQLNHLAYADDVALVADNEENMRELLRTMEKGAQIVGLTINPSKCASLHIVGGAKPAVHPSVFSIQGEAIAALGESEHYKHLGIPTGYQVKQTPVNTIAAMIRDAEKVDNSLLAPWQKLDALGTFILPRLDFLLQSADFEKSFLTEADKEFKRLAKRWMHLPRRASPELTFIPASKGGGGILPLGDLYDISVVAHSYRMLYAPDNSVSSISRNLLRDTVSARLRRPASDVELGQFLSNTLELPRYYPMSSSWCRVREAMQRVGSRLGLQWSWSEEGGYLEIHYAGRPIAKPNTRHLLYKRLRQRLNEVYERRLRQKRSQGKVFEASSAAPDSNHFLRTGRYTRFCDWRFIHRARLNVLPVNGAMKFLPGLNTRCRRCDYQDETLPHVLNHCTIHSAAWQQRHNSIQDRLVKAIRCPGEISVNRTIQGIQGPATRLRPDIVVRDVSNNIITIVDVAVPFESRQAAFSKKREEKLQKYAPLAQQLRQQGFRVHVAAFLVGSLGAYDLNNQHTLDLLQVNKSYAGMMRRLMVSDTIRWSRDIYVEHLKRPPIPASENQLQP